LYAGLGPNVVESALSSGVYFFFYSKLREQAVAWSKRGNSVAGAESRSKDIGVLASLLVATIAGACNQLITMPASVVATRMQVSLGPGKQEPECVMDCLLAGVNSKRRPPSTRETINSVFKEGGLGAFWKGLLPSMILLANPAVQYMLFEKIKAILKLRTAAGATSVELSAGEVFLAGALAKIGATVVTYPLIVIKARLQASSSASVGKGHGGAAAYRATTWGVMVDTARNEGLGGFFKGLRAKILQTALNAALMLMLKEQLHEVTKRELTRLAPAPPSVPAAAAVVRAPSAAG
ncbi:hypothetical protein VOLCADRAFT_69839, partial [Volvox carteri f. nagariensis]